MPERLLKTSVVTEEEDLSSYCFGFGAVPQKSKKIKKEEEEEQGEEEAINFAGQRRDPILPASRLRTCVRGINTMINISCSHITGAWISIPSLQPKQRLAKLFKQIQSNTLYLFQFPRRTRHLILLFKSFSDGENSHCGRLFSSFARSLVPLFAARTLARSFAP